ncbi:conserved hypothetical protein [Flavobacterium sp. 9AF]|uniref:hypothetical protein n=1 Tax=Flavobacterium sp. 9AF TaxID=2653142 RepID=UPI0012F03F2E|nr:hypothetical protein [Flavobacterium sp. 9AF]VXB49816.1 conserved hypothetical protein [Flavobacterium sp. 9AF]
MNKKQLFHVIWTSFESFPVWDKKGNWENLALAYLELKNQGIVFELSKPFQQVYLNEKERAEAVVFNEHAIVHLTQDILDLCQPNGDRLVASLEIEWLDVEASKVEMLVWCEANLLHQKIGRLKSRTATLLSFAYPEDYFGKGTWAKGFWYARIENQESLAISILKAHLPKDITAARKGTAED